MILITGATGHIGNVLTGKLYERGFRDLRLFVREGEDFSYVQKYASEIVTGDITSPEDVMRAVEGCDKVFHVAGLVQIEGRDTERIYRVNVGGTQNVVDACLACGVKRLVYVSSVHALEALPDGRAIDETLEDNVNDLLGAYARSKAMATTAVLSGVQKGLDGVIVFPTGVIGPYNYQSSHTTTAIATFLNAKKVQYYFDGAYDFVDVRDVADGLIAAMEKGERGQGYILAGSRVTLEELLNEVENLTGTELKRRKIPTFFVLLGASLAPMYYKLIGKKPLFNKYSIKVLLSNSVISDEKAKKKLGYKPRPMAETLRDVVAWIRRRPAKD